MTNIIDPSSPVGSVISNILASIGFVTIVAIVGWITGPIRWWYAGRSLKQLLLSGRSFLFVFNPTSGQAKVMTFLPNGEIGEGRNSNEHSWRIRHGKLEIYAFDKAIYSRFTHDKKTGRISHTNDSDTRSIHGQYILPHYMPWPNTDTDQSTLSE